MKENHTKFVPAIKTTHNKESDPNPVFLHLPLLSLFRELDSKLYKPGVTTELYIYLVQPGLLLLFVFVIFSYFSEVL